MKYDVNKFALEILLAVIVNETNRICSRIEKKIPHFKCQLIKNIAIIDTCVKWDLFKIYNPQK